MTSDRQWHDVLGQPVQADDETLPAPGPLPGEAITWRWLTHAEYAKVMGAGSVIDRPECCGCHRTIAAADGYSAVPFDAKGMPTMVKISRGQSSVQRFSYVFCGACRVASDAEHAWRHALADDLARPAGKRNRVPTTQLDHHPKI